jgi:hypothetical protein
MDEFTSARKVKLQRELVAAATSFLKHVRAHETPPAAILIPLDDARSEFLALGPAADISGLLKHEQ